MMPKKTAAAEVYKVYKLVKWAGIAWIATVFIAVLGTMFNTWIGTIIAAISSGFGGYCVFISTQKMRYFYMAYGVGKRQDWEIKQDAGN